MEGWSFADERELVSFKGIRSCATCSRFRYVALAQCQVLGACRLKERLLPPGTQLIRQCNEWTYATPWAMASDPPT